MNETPHNETHTTPAKKTGMKTLTFWALAVIALGVFAYFVFGTDRLTDSKDVIFPGNEVAITGLPTDDATVVATINGETLTQGEVNQLINSDLIGQGISFEDLSAEEQVAQQARSVELMIDYKVLLQAAYASDVEIDEAEANSQIELIKAQFTEEEFSSQLAQLNVTEEQLAKTLRDSTVIDAYLQSKILTEDVVVTEEEINAQIAQIAEDAGGQAALDAQLDTMGMSQEDFRANIRQGLEAQKQQVLIETKIDSLRAAATIERM